MCSPILCDVCAGRSMRELVEEAESFAAGHGRKVKPKHKKKHKEKAAPEKTVRTVDEIIASLKVETKATEK